MTVTARIKTETDHGTRGEFRATLDLAHAGPAELEIRYEVAGPKDAPLLIVAGGISSGRHVIATAIDPTDGWWQSQSTTFRRYSLLSINWLGAHGELDRPIDPSDQAKAFLATLDYLRLDHATAFVGASYGAMVGMHCAAIAPDRVPALLAISAAHRSHPFASAQRALQRQAIELGERLGAPETGVALARKLAILTYRTPEEFAERFATPSAIEHGRARASSEPYLDHMGEKHSAKMGAAAYRRLSESIDLHRIDPAAIAVPATFVAVDSDQLVPSADTAALANAVWNARFVSIPSLYGHDAFLKEEHAIAAIIDNFLNSLEQPQ
ncbi:MAG TPA: homoserine O-succinyltransferase [Sphingomicrobium sp.]|nr:homoserine O-succinyltransferase [Sphingomicrobium sp.]